MISRREFLKINGLFISALGFARNLFSRSKNNAAPQLKNMVAGVSPLTKEDYDMRQEKARRLMTEQKIDALFLSGSAKGY